MLVAICSMFTFENTTGERKVSIPSHAGRRKELIKKTSDSFYAHEERIRNGCGFILTMRQRSGTVKCL